MMIIMLLLFFFFILFVSKMNSAEFKDLDLDCVVAFIHPLSSPSSVRGYE